MLKTVRAQHFTAAPVLVHSVNCAKLFDGILELNSLALEGRVGDGVVNIATFGGDHAVALDLDFEVATFAGVDAALMMHDADGVDAGGNRGVREDALDIRAVAHAFGGAIGEVIDQAVVGGVSGEVLPVDDFAGGGDDLKVDIGVVEPGDREAGRAVVDAGVAVAAGAGFAIVVFGAHLAFMASAGAEGRHDILRVADARQVELLVTNEPVFVVEIPIRRRAHQRNLKAHQVGAGHSTRGFTGRVYVEIRGACAGVRVDLLREVGGDIGRLNLQVARDGVGEVDGQLGVQFELSDEVLFALKIRSVTLDRHSVAPIAFPSTALFLDAAAQGTVGLDLAGRRQGAVEI